MFYLLRYLVVITLYSQVSLLAQAQWGAEVPQTIDELTDIKSRSVSQKEQDVITWQGDDNASVNIVGILSQKDAKKVNILSLFDGEQPVATLLADKHSTRYQVFHDRRPYLEGWTLTARAENTEGIVDRVDLWKPSGKALTIGSYDRKSTPQYISASLDDRYIGTLLFDSTATTFTTLLVFDKREDRYTTLGYYGASDHPLQSLFIQTDNKKWVELVFDYDTGQRAVSSIGIHHEYPGHLQEAYFDLTNNGHKNVRMSMHKGKPSLELDNTNWPPLPSSSDIQVLIDTLDSFVLDVEARWHETKDVFMTARAMGYRFPEVSTTEL